MLAISLAAAALLLGPGAPIAPITPYLQRALPPVSQIRESRLAKIKEIEPGQRYRGTQPAKYYSGHNPSNSVALRDAVKKAGTRKLVLVTGTSSGLGLYCVEALLKKREGYFVIAAVRDPEKMDAAASEAGISKQDYVSVELQLASFQSVRDLADDIKKEMGRRGLDRLVCNAAVYLPTDPKPRFTDDGYEMSLQVNHLGHFLLVQLLLPQLKKAKDARCCIVGSVTGNKNTVAGGLVKPVADVGRFEGFKQGPGQEMVDGAKFYGAKAYKDAKAMNMMTVLELDRRLNKDTGIIFNSMYPGCIAMTSLFREKREWFRYFFFPTLMKAIGSYVSQNEAGERLAQVIADEATNESGVYWSWNGDAKYMGVGNAGGAGGELFRNQFSGMVRDPELNKLCWEYSMEAVKDYL